MGFLVSVCVCVKKERGWGSLCVVGRGEGGGVVGERECGWRMEEKC